MPIEKSEIRSLVHHVDPDSPPPILRFEIQSVGTQGLLWSAKRLRPIAGGVFVVTGEPFDLHRTAGSVTLNIDDRGWMIWKRDVRQWEVLTSAAGTGVSVVRFVLNEGAEHEQNSTTPVDANIVEWNGAGYVPKAGAAIWVVDSVGEWGKAAAGFEGWGVQISDRPTYETSGSERAVYEILFLESYARWGGAELRENMGQTIDNEAEAQISTAHEQWGAAPNHRPHPAEIITIKDRYRAGGCLKSGDQVLWLWNEQTDTYYLLAPQAGGKVSVREKDPCDYLENQMHNETEFDAGVRGTEPNEDTDVFTDVWNYSKEVGPDDYEIRDYVNWAVVDKYYENADVGQVLFHGGGQVRWLDIEEIDVVVDIKIDYLAMEFQKMVKKVNIVSIPDNRLGTQPSGWIEWGEGTVCD